MAKYSPKTMPTAEEVREFLAGEYPNYKVVIQKNPIAGPFVEVQKNGFIGCAVWLKTKKNTISTNGTVPSVAVRLLLMGGLLLLFVYGSQRKLQKEVDAKLAEKFPA